MRDLHHVAYWTREFDADLARHQAAGLEIGQSGQTGGADGRFVYFTAEQHPGSVIELSEISGPKGAFFDRIAAAAADWDGSHAHPPRHRSRAIEESAARWVQSIRTGYVRADGIHNLLPGGRQRTAARPAA